MDGCGRHLAKLKTIWPKNIEANGDNALPFMFAVPKISIYINGFYIILNIIAICPFFRLFLFGHKLVETVYGGNCFDTRNRTALPTTMIYWAHCPSSIVLCSLLSVFDHFLNYSLTIVQEKKICLFIIFTEIHSFQPEFVEGISNVSVAVGRDATFTCHVRHLGGYRVSMTQTRHKTKNHRPDTHSTRRGPLAHHLFFRLAVNIFMYLMCLKQSCIW